MNQDDYEHLFFSQRQIVDAVADTLRKTGAYGGSETDAITDAMTIMRAAQFAPPLGDNHHNAFLCPYCNESMLK